jgi:SH3 domain-containing protein
MSGRRRNAHLASTGVLFLILGLPLYGCAGKPAETTPAPTAARRAERVQVAIRAEQDRRISRLELALLEKTAQVEELQARLDDAREEVVRAMAKLQTLASRAEAASGMAEAEVALQPLRARTAQQSAPEAAQASQLLREAAAEFNQENYGGALYLASQAKAMAAAGTGRLSAREHTSDRPGEKPFAVPIPLKTVGSGNVREAPGTAAPVAFAVAGGDSLTGYSYVEDWVRVSDDMGRGGWIFRKLIVRR